MVREYLSLLLLFLIVGVCGVILIKQYRSWNECPCGKQHWPIGRTR